MSARQSANIFTESHATLGACWRTLGGQGCPRSQEESARLVNATEIRSKKIERSEYSRQIQTGMDRIDGIKREVDRIGFASGLIPHITVDFWNAGSDGDAST
jgi:hypothetical protein